MAIFHTVNPLPPPGLHAGGVYYSANGVLIARRLGQQRDPASTAQIPARRSICGPSLLWPHTLTGVQRITWHAYAAATPVHGRDGHLKTLVGYAMFLRNCRPRLLAGLPLIYPGPTTPGFPPYTPPTPTTVQNQPFLWLSITNTDAWCTQTNAAMYVWCSRPTPANQSTPTERYALIGVIASNPAGIHSFYRFPLQNPPRSPATASWARVTVTDDQGRLSE